MYVYMYIYMYVYTVIIQGGQKQTLDDVALTILLVGLPAPWPAFVSTLIISGFVCEMKTTAH